MDNHFDVEKLFIEKLQNFEQETTAKFDQAMEQKIDQLQWQRWIKWILGGVLVATLAILVSLNLDSPIKEEKHHPNEKEKEVSEMFPSTPLREQKDVDLDILDANEYTERSRSVQQEKSEEKHLLDEKEKEEMEMSPSTPLREQKDVDLDILDAKEYTERSRIVQQEKSEEKHQLGEKENEDMEMFPSTPLREQKDIDVDILDDKEYTEQNRSVPETIASIVSPEYIPSYLTIKPLLLDNRTIELAQKPNLYPVSLVEENAKAKKQQQKKEKKDFKLQQKLENEKLKARQLEDKKQREAEVIAEKQAFKKQKYLNKEKQKAEQQETKQHNKELNRQKKKSPKFSNQKLSNNLNSNSKKSKKNKSKFSNNSVPGVYEGAIEFSAAPVFIKNLSPPLEPENDTVTVWLTNEEFKPSYDFGLEFMFKQKESNWLVKTGLHYQKFTEEVHYYFLREYIDEAQSHWNYDSIFEYHIDPPNFDTILVDVDSTYYEHWERNERSQKYTNQYQYLNIPILLGYHIDMRKQTKDPDYKKGFDFHVLAGTGIGILLKNKGYHYDTDGYIYSYPTSQETTIDWYLHAQLAMNYHWKNISIFAKPKLQFQTRNRSFDEYFENRHYLIYGVDFGVRLKILFRRAPKRDKLSTKQI